MSDSVCLDFVFGESGFFLVYNWGRIMEFYMRIKLGIDLVGWWMELFCCVLVFILEFFGGGGGSLDIILCLLEVVLFSFKFIEILWVKDVFCIGGVYLFLMGEFDDLKYFDYVGDLLKEF